MYDIAVCDDCGEDRLFLIERILANGIGSTEARIHEYASGEELLEGMKNIDLSLVFLDIQMDGVNGEDTALQLREEGSTAILVFYSGMPNPTPKGIEVLPYRYISKIMPLEKIDEYVEAAMLRMIADSDKPVLTVMFNRNYYRIRLDHILYFEKYKRCTRIHIIKEMYKFYGIELEDDDDESPVLRIKDRLDLLYDRLKKYGFGCPHDSYIINFKYMTHCSPKELRLEQVDHIFPISRGKTKEYIFAKDNFFHSKYI